MGLFDNFGKKAGQWGGAYFGGLYGMGAGGKMGASLDGGGGGGGSDPYSGMPQGYPTYLGMEGNQLNTPIEWDRRAEGKLNQEALRTGLSKNSQLALDMNAKGVTNAKSNARGMATGLENQARSNLAMKGGLDSGAAERIAKQSMGNALDLTQQAEAGGNQNAMGIRMQDEDRRMAGLESAQGMNANNAQGLFGMRNQNMQNLIGENTRRNAFNMNSYNQQMAAWGAGKQADATANSGKK
jgi:hypothetical protein